MAVLGTLIGGALGAFGKKPNVPLLPEIDPSKVQQQTIAGNAEALPEAAALAEKANTFSIEQIKKALELAMPGQFSKASANTSALLAGELPQDVAQQVFRSAAAAGFSGGIQGSELNRNLALRDLGLTSLQAQQQGFNQFGALSSMFTPRLSDATAMFFSPQQRLAFEMEDRQQKFQRNMLHETVKAAPDPFKAALGQAFIQDEEAIMKLIGDVVGMVGGAAGAMCWVARAAFGTKTPHWRLFRVWMLTRAPAWLRSLYVRHGEALGRIVERSRSLRAIVRALMTPAINSIARSYGISLRWT